MIYGDLKKSFQSEIFLRSVLISIVLIGIKESYYSESLLTSYGYVWIYLSLIVSSEIDFKILDIKWIKENKA